jgi:PAS domain S-box-containing protein
MFYREEESTIEGDAPAATTGTATVDRRELALVAVERTRMPMVITDARQPDNPIVLANQAFLDLTGYAASEVVGRNCRFLQGPDTDHAAIEKIKEGLRAGNDHLTVELLNYRKNGSSFWNQLAISPVFDEHGELAYYFASQEDITAERRRKYLERTEPRLLMEIDHRSINALALVQSILRLTRAETVERFSSQVGARVDALARAHRLLANAGWSAVNLHDAIALEVPASVQAQVRADGPPTLVRPQYVQTLVLMFHELVANAIEHGPLGSTEGALEIDWAVDCDLLILKWFETGGTQMNGQLSREFARGFGLTMIQRTVERQLGGELRVDWHNDGLKLAIRIPYQTIVAAMEENG